MSENKPDSVPGLGFKDEEKAHESLKILEGRDPEYQRLAIKGLIGRAKRVLTLTKDKEKLQNIKNAMQIFDDWLKDYDNSNLSKENRAYLSLGIMQSLRPLLEQHNVLNDTTRAFVAAFEKVKGEYKSLRTLESDEKGVTWDIVRNRKLKPIVKQCNDNDSKLWDGELPTRAHLEMIVWSYSPDAARIKKNLTKIEEKIAAERGGKRNKRKSSQSESASDSDESPKKISKK